MFAIIKIALRIVKNTVTEDSSCFICQRQKHYIFVNNMPRSCYVINNYYNQSIVYIVLYTII